MCYLTACGTWNSFSSHISKAVADIDVRPTEGQAAEPGCLAGKAKRDTCSDCDILISGR